MKDDPSSLLAPDGRRVSRACSSAVLPHVKDPEDEYIAPGHLVSNLIVGHQHSPNFAGLEFGEPSAQTRVAGNSLRARNKLSNDASRGGNVNGLEKLVQANQIRTGAAGPPEGHELAPSAPLWLGET